MELFELVLNKAAMYNMLFISAKSVLEYPTLEILNEKNPIMYERWKTLSKDVINNDHYQSFAVNYPEFCKIASISYGNVYLKDGKPERSIKTFSNTDESFVVESFMAVLREKSIECELSKTWEILTGHNIANYIIPLLIKRFYYLRNNFEVKELPQILKRSLSFKPWDAGIVDTVNVWKFNGNYSLPSSLMLISSFLGIKEDKVLIDPITLSRKYWEGMESAPKKIALSVGLQSQTEIGILMSLIDNLRK